MKKEDILKVLEEANKASGKFSDAQLSGQQTINQNRTKESCSKGGKIGGVKGGIKSRDEKTGFHAMKREDRVKLAKKIGNKIGPRSYKEGFGIFGLSKEEIIKNAIAGGRASVNSTNHNSNKRLTCPHCNKEGTYLIMRRWHMDKCKHKKL
jgi:hypothetical protein